MEQQLSNISVEFNGVLFPDQIPEILINRNLASLLGIIKLNEVIDVNLVDVEWSAPLFTVFTGILSFNGNLFKAAIPEALYFKFKANSNAGEWYYMPLKLAVSFVSNDAVILKIIKIINMPSPSQEGGLLKLMSLVNENFTRIAENNFLNLNEFDSKLNLNINSLNTIMKNNTLVFNFNFNVDLSAFPVNNASIAISFEQEDKKEDMGIDADKITGGNKALFGGISPDSPDSINIQDDMPDDAEFIRGLKNRILSPTHLEADRLNEIKSKIKTGQYADSSKIADGILKASENRS